MQLSEEMRGSTLKEKKKFYYLYNIMCFVPLDPLSVLVTLGQ